MSSKRTTTDATKARKAAANRRYRLKQKAAKAMENYYSISEDQEPGTWQQDEVHAHAVKVAHKAALAAKAAYDDACFDDAVPANADADRILGTMLDEVDEACKLTATAAKEEDVDLEEAPVAGLIVEAKAADKVWKAARKTRKPKATRKPTDEALGLRGLASCDTWQDAVGLWLQRQADAGRTASTVATYRAALLVLTRPYGEWRLETDIPLAAFLASDQVTLNARGVRRSTADLSFVSGMVTRFVNSVQGK